MAADAFIQCRVSAATKEALRAAAFRQQLTESALLKRLLEQILMVAEPVAVTRDADRIIDARTLRISVRLQPDDWLLLRERASARRMPAATYVSVLIRAHMRSLSPLPKEELAALKRTVSEVSAIGRSLNQWVLHAHQGARVPGPGREDLRAMLNACEALRDHVRGLIKANVTSWQVGHADTIV